MLVLKKIREFCFNVSTLFGLGESFFGAFGATLISIILLVLGRFINRIIPDHYFDYVLFFIFLLYLLILFLGLGFVTEKDKSTIVLNKTVGMLFVFYGVNLRFKFIVTGYFLFHVLVFLAPFVFYKIFDRKVETLPAYLEPLFGDVVYGIVCNLFLRFLIWFAR